MKRAPKMSRNKLIIVNLSGRGDKDVTQVPFQIINQMILFLTLQNTHGCRREFHRVFRFEAESFPVRPYLA
jgi:hypothetical protein